MSVLVKKRKKSKFEVFDHWYNLRKELTDLLLRDFGYSFEKAEARLNKRFGNKPFEEMDETEKERYQKTKERYEAFDEWFIEDERNTITAYMREVTKHCFVANSNYPYIDEEYVQRRLHQDEAIGFCFAIKQELQYAIETLPVDVNVYLRFAEMIDKEVALIKAWRKSDNRIRDSKE